MARILGRRTAKVIYRLGALLSWVKTPKRLYGPGPSGEIFGDDAVYTGRRWLSCRASLSLMLFAERLDWDHFDHWACRHDDCGGHRCEVCGGIDCEAA